MTRGESSNGYRLVHHAREENERRQEQAHSPPQPSCPQGKYSITKIVPPSTHNCLQQAVLILHCSLPVARAVETSCAHLDIPHQMLPVGKRIITQRRGRSGASTTSEARKCRIQNFDPATPKWRMSRGQFGLLAAPLASICTLRNIRQAVGDFRVPMRQVRGWVSVVLSDRCAVTIPLPKHTETLRTCRIRPLLWAGVCFQTCRGRSGVSMLIPNAFQYTRRSRCSLALPAEPSV